MRLNNILLITTTCLFLFVLILFTATNTYAKKKKKSEMYLVLDIDGEINYKATFDSLTSPSISLPFFHLRSTLFVFAFAVIPRLPRSA